MFGGPDTEIKPDGSFALQGLSAGDYILTATGTTESKLLDEGYAKVRVVDRSVRANIQLGAGASMRGMIALKGSDGLLQGMQVFLEPAVGTQGPGLLIYPAAVDKDRRFDIRNVPPGDYRFTMRSTRGEADRLYITQVRCGGTDYTTQPVTLDVGAALSDCEVKTASDVGVVRGEVKEGDNPKPGVVVVLIPQSREPRHVRRYTLETTTDAAGRFEFSGAIPGEYFLFAIPANEDGEEFALNFAERNQQSAESVEVKAGEAQVVALKFK
jgi:hypothetical protein